MLGARGVRIRNIALESPEMLGRAERHGDMWKMNAKRVIQDQKVRGPDQMKLLAVENNVVMNDTTRKGGFSPSQWVLGKFPRRPGDQFDEDEFADLGIVSERMDLESAFQMPFQTRLACKKAFA